MIQRLDDFNWKEAFAYATGERTGDGADFAAPSPVRDATCTTGPFEREDVTCIVAIDDGENDGPEWIGVFALRDGRFAVLRAGCDYTGWD